ncbi:MAG: hypothetical protein EOM90_06925 [Alphaproteobacteria bacterium]|nr:hypothetical protein [Alphaproteobacteria bacterium]
MSTVNETYARADNFRDVVHVDSSVISITLSENNTISVSDMATAYQQMVDSISQHYYLITGDKGLIFVDLEVVSTQNGQVTIKITDLVTATSYTPSYQFGTTDYWFWGWAGGKCDGSGQNVGQDAADKLAQHANWSVPVLAQCFYTDISETGWLYPNSSISTNSNPYGYGAYLVYQHSGNGSGNDCLSPDVMNYYLDCLKIIGSNFKPSGKEIIKYLCQDDFTVLDAPAYYHCHKANIRYGVPISAPAPANDL